MKKHKFTFPALAGSLCLLGSLTAPLIGATIEVGDGMDTAAELSLGFTMTTNRGGGSQPLITSTTGITDNSISDPLYDGIGIEVGFTTVDSSAEVMLGFYGSETYTPSISGELLTIDYSVFASEIGAGDAPVIPILRQGGVDYAYVGTGVVGGLTSQGFRPNDGNADDGSFAGMTLSGVSASDFITINLTDNTSTYNLIPPTTSGSPDFTATGGTIEFGWAMGAATSGTSNNRNVRILTTGSQTTSVLLTTVPETSTALLVSLGALAMLRRRRS